MIEGVSAYGGRNHRRQRHSQRREIVLADPPPQLPENIIELRFSVDRLCDGLELSCGLIAVDFGDEGEGLSVAPAEGYADPPPDLRRAQLLRRS